MAVLTNAILQSQCNVVVDALDVGSPDPPRVVLYTAADAPLATINLNTGSAFGVATLASPSVATALDLPLAFTGSGAGTVAKYIAMNRSGAECWHGLCGPEAGKLHLDNYVIAVGQSGSMTSFTWSQPTGAD